MLGGGGKGKGEAFQRGGAPNAAQPVHTRTLSARVDQVFNCIIRGLLARNPSKKTQPNFSVSFLLSWVKIFPRVPFDLTISGSNNTRMTRLCVCNWESRSERQYSQDPRRHFWINMLMFHQRSFYSITSKTGINK